jgi:hypothetical protein
VDRKSKKKIVDALADGFWGSVDWLVGARKRVDASKQESRRRRGVEDPPTTETASREAPTPLETAEPSTDPPLRPSRPVLRRGRRPFEFRGVLAFFRREAKRPVETVICAACGHDNAPPVVFCEQCSEPFVQIGKAFTLGLLTLALTCFFTAEYFRESLLWAWPLYIFYAAAFLAMNAAMMKRATALSLTVFGWGAAFMAGGFLVGMLGPARANDLVISSIGVFSRDYLSDVVGASIFYGALALIAVIFMLWLSRRYTFAHAYRICFILLAAVAGSLHLFYLIAFEPTGALLAPFDREDLHAVAEPAAVNLLRVLAAELLIYSLVKSHKPAMEAFAKRRVRPRAAKPGRGVDPMEPFYRFSIVLTNAALRFYLQIEKMVIRLGATLNDLARRIADFAWVMSRDLLIPVASLVVAAAAVYRLALSSGAYIAEHRPIELVRIAMAAPALAVAQLAFLCAKTRLAPRKLLANHLHLLVWFSPYLLTLFIFMSISLWFVGLALMRWNLRASYAYRIGPLTIAALALIAPMVVFAVIRRHRSEGDGEDADGAGAGES